MNKFLLLIIAVAIFVGCSKKNNSPSTSIVGKWNITADTDRVYDNGTLDETSILNESISPYVQFNADGSGVLMNDITGGGATIKFTYSVSGNVIKFHYPAQIINGIEVAAFERDGTFKRTGTNDMEIIFDSTVLQGGDSERDYEVVYVIA
jgi:hypothetical protein